MATMVISHDFVLGLFDHSTVWIKFFLEVIGPYKSMKQEFSLDPENFTGLYYRSWTNLTYMTDKCCCIHRGSLPN